MADLELPPADFARLTLRIVRRKPAALVRLAWDEPATRANFRKDACHRFDSPDGTFGVLYVAFDLKTAFAETVLRARPTTVGTSRSVPIPFSEIEARRVIELAPTTPARTLKLIKLYDDGLAAAHVDNRIATIDDYSITQQWAKALHAHPCNADGAVYISRYVAPRKSVVLFDRGAGKIKIGRVTPLLQHEDFAKVSNAFNLSIEK